MKITNLIKYSMISGIFFLGACTHQNVKVIKPADDKLSCSDIAAEIAEINGVLRSIDDKTGLSGRNVAMELKSNLSCS